mmetsp:Transcript_14337/g.20626  ORF Transcript_14337/g.20626 Transcript_14337/m.20626 type:complete len:228 (+) Transcript_14337:213-896(+)|eukprot:CAMPEP_0202456242 /NCGR_PEP_ID=MMETSP1360-20130828/13554_1 /ASSEMBLY_ACC=CAM_ASM_000848 /TAXON_ID=515479 /ORGANISM="Licmophora paradoxa, Strain CCMP2313" /LENGTH=227 /DNA_ID=CAMNT_0049075995 /DNA_START=32 /DNA_END=715 /DNA_ORIENTATION=+
MNKIKIYTDPITGQQTKKQSLGGAYPGQRRKVQAPYTPPVDDFDKNGQATAHFVQYGGGNALVLVNGPNPHPQYGNRPTEYISVTLPSGVSPGDTIHVQSPDGRTNAVVVPDGMGPGSKFTVQFEDEERPLQAMPVHTASGNNPTTSCYVPETTTTTTSANTTTTPAYTPFTNATTVIEEPTTASVTTPYVTAQTVGQDDFVSGFGQTTTTTASAYPAPPQYPQPRY